MRILYVTQWFEPEPTFKGVAFVKALMAAGHEVQVATGFPNYPGGKLYPGYSIRPFMQETIDGVRVDRLPLWPSHDRSTLGRIVNYLSFFLSVLCYCLMRMGRYDLVYIYHPPVTPALAVAVARSVHKVPFVVEIQDLWPDSVAVSGMANPRIVAVLDRLCHYVYGRAAQIICQSAGMAARLIDRGVAGDKINQIYNSSTYLPAAADDPAVPDSILRSFEGRINMVYAGNMGPAQALEHIVEAAKIAHRAVPALRLHLIGNGIDREHLSTLAAEAPDAVMFHAPLPRRTVDRVMDRADILTLHLKSDPLFDITIPSKSQHYLAAGRPIIAGLTGEARQLLESSGAALISAPGAVASLAADMVAVARLSPDQRADLGARGAAYYHGKLSFSAGMSKTLEVLERASKG